MKRPLTPAEEAIVLPLVKRRSEFMARVEELQLGINATVAALHGAAEDGLDIEAGRDGRVWLKWPDPKPPTPQVLDPPEPAPDPIQTET